MALSPDGAVLVAAAFHGIGRGLTWQPNNTDIVLANIRRQNRLCITNRKASPLQRRKCPPHPPRIFDGDIVYPAACTHRDPLDGRGPVDGGHYRGVVLHRYGRGHGGCDSMSGP